jgi:Tol biopolymer transport system component
MSRLTLLLAAGVLLTGCEPATEPVEPPSETGVIEVTSLTAGDPIDPDGYLLAVDGGPGTVFGTNSTLTLPDVAAGEHRLELGGLAANCEVAGLNPRTVAVSGGGTARTSFEVECTTPPQGGSIEITVSTTGERPDPDGYAVSLDGEAGSPIATNGTISFTGVTAGSHRVGLTGLAPNCTVSGGENPRTVAVVDGGSSEVGVDIHCLAAGEGLILFTSDRGGTSRLYRMKDDGTSIVGLTPSAEAFDGDWSPDGSRIVFTATDGQGVDIFVMEADGSNPSSLGVSGGNPRWSPDGRRILFTSGGSYITDPSINVMNADGSSVTTLTTGGSPDWSPDGASIVFQRIGECVSVLFCTVDIFVMATNGTQVRKLVSGASTAFAGPAWSPDGSRIAFTRRCCFLGPNENGVWVIGLTGGVPTRIDSRAAWGRPVWSPDGSAIAFAAAKLDGTTELTVIPSAGGAGIVLASNNGSEYPTSWK